MRMSSLMKSLAAKSENSDPAETTGSTEVDSEIESSDSEVPDSFDGASEEINDISEDEETGDFESSEDQDFQTEKNRKIIQRMLKKMSQIHWKKQNLIMQMEKSVSTITASFY